MFLPDKKIMHWDSYTLIWWDCRVLKKPWLVRHEINLILRDKYKYPVIKLTIPQIFKGMIINCTKHLIPKYLIHFFSESPSNNLMKKPGKQGLTQVWWQCLQGSIQMLWNWLLRWNYANHSRFFLFVFSRNIRLTGIDARML